MGRLERIAGAIAAILAREGLDYAQSKTVFKLARQRAGLAPSPDHRGSIDRLTLEEELRFIDQAYAKGGRTGLMLQTLLETGHGCPSWSSSGSRT
jgi:integrase/recombinase XerD